MIKLIATDLDGTLLSPNKMLSQIGRKAILAAVSNNVLFVVSSGRFYSSLNKMFQKFDEKMVLIANNGAWVQRAGYGEILCKSTISRERVEEFVKYIRNNFHESVYLCNDDGAVIDDCNEEMMLDFILSQNNFTITNNILSYGRDICRMGVCLNSNNSDEMNEKIVKNIRERYSGEFETLLGGRLWLDVMDKGITKGHALGVVQKLYNIKPEETMVFGDYYNDIGMFKNAYYSFAMENAPDEVKSHANFIAKSNRDDGVAKEILKLWA